MTPTQETAAMRNFDQAHARFGSCVTSIGGPNGCAQLYERCRKVLGGRQSGAGLKPLQAAVAKSDGSERCSQRRDDIPAGEVERGERKRTVDEVSKAD